MADGQTRADQRAARISAIDPSLASVLDEMLVGVPEVQHDEVRGAVAAFLAWIEATGKEFPGYDEAFEAYADAMEGTPAASTMLYVQLLLVVLRDRTNDEPRGAHTAA